MADLHIKNTPPLVSVIIPTLNGEQFLKQAIDSVYKQSFQNFELIITDDVSTDGTEKIVSKYQKDSRLYFFQNKNRLGIGGNWNYGIQQARGKYIKILCQDDLLMENYLEEKISVLEEFDSVTLVSSFEEFLGEFERVKNRANLPAINRDSKLANRIDGHKAQQTIFKFGNWIGGPTSAMFRSKDLRDIGFFNESLSCSLDTEYWLRLLAVGDLFIVPKILFKTRLHRAQESNNCIRNLGFRKDRIHILHAVKTTPELFGNHDIPELNRLSDRSMLKLLEGAKSNTVRFWDACIYIKNYSTIHKTLFILFKFLGIKIYQKLFKK